MAEVRPFRALRYVSDSTDITDLVAPPYDVISPDERAALIEDSPHNVVLLELPDGSTDPTDPESRYVTGARTLSDWIEQDVLATDDQEAYYVMVQDFTETIAGEKNGFTRIAVFSAVQLHEFADEVILPHEATLPKALGDRYELLTRTEANLSPIFGLYALEDRTPLDALIEHAIASGPIAGSTGKVGDRTALYASYDPSINFAFTAAMTDVPVVIADGHHRYTVAVANAREQDVLGDAEHPAASVMMALVEEQDTGLVVKGYHRIITPKDDLDVSAALDALSAEFTVEPLDSLDGVLDILDENTYVLLENADTAHKLTGKNLLATMRTLTEEAGVEHTDEHLALDTVVAAQLILPELGIDTSDPADLEHLAFTDDEQVVMDAVEKDGAIGLLLAPLTVQMIGDVARSGDVTPQKSTFFTPKLPSGFLMRDLDPDRS